MSKATRWLAVSAATGALTLLGLRWADGSRPEEHSSAARPPELVSPVSSTPPVNPSSNVPAAESTPQRAPPSGPGAKDPFATFQTAIRSNDLSTLETGLAAWRQCAGYVFLGSSDIESWVTTVMPSDLPKAEWDRRAGFARSSAKRCAGFAMQSDALELSQSMRVRAIELGSVSETVRLKLGESAGKEDQAIVDDLASASCDLVRQYGSGSHAAIRLITPAMRRGGYVRPSHFLNAVSIPAKNIGINLALCDLDPEGCGPDSQFVGSACVQSGKCGIYANEIEFWKGESTPAVWGEAQTIRQQITSAVRSADCSALFR